MIYIYIFDNPFNRSFVAEMKFYVRQLQRGISLNQFR